MFFSLSTIYEAKEFPPEMGVRTGMERIPAGLKSLNGLVPFLKLNLSQNRQKELLDIFLKIPGNEITIFGFHDGIGTGNGRNFRSG